MLDSKSKKKILELAKSTRQASLQIAKATTEQKNNLLKEVLCRIDISKQDIIAANNEDLAKLDVKEFTKAFIERLKLDDNKIEQIKKNIEDVISLEDPVGKREFITKRPNGIDVYRQSIPLGVISIIYESRPNVTSDAAILCLKSGNATILRGGSECFNTNKSIIKIIKESLEAQDFDSNCINMIPLTDREAMKYMLTLEEEIDLVIPRGGEKLIRFIAEFSRIPVIKHYKGVCHVYIDNEADLKKGLEISLNSKIQRPGVCNSMETLLVHKDVAKDFLPSLARSLKHENVKIHSERNVIDLIPNIDISPIKENDWENEYLDLEMNIKIVENINEAIAHIEKYGSLHTETIVTKSIENAELFINSVNSSAIMHNVSTRFNDGNELGLGAEIGISTTKLHAFGPMGLKELTTKKFVIFGEGQVK
ncbi:MAG: glutamate-5-semialdehyde dehydrogenase [Thermodesulfobacteriota bacterium]|nr:MAG: glutamate-5-semialdehyde dehydrogenase [Candidatus Dadabacteria bacterium]